MDRKVTTLFLKKIRNKQRVVIIYEDDSCYWITDAHMAFKVLKKEMELNPSLFEKSVQNSIVYDLNNNIYKDAEIKCVKPLYGIWSNELYAEIESMDGIKARAMVEFLKYFKNSNFKVTEEKRNPIACYKNGELIGCILPVIGVREGG